MEMLPGGWLPEFEAEEDEDHVLIDGMEMDSGSDLTPEQFSALYNEDYLQNTLGTFSGTSESSQIWHERPRKQLKGSITIASGNSDTTEQKSSPQATSSPIAARYGILASSPNPKSSGKIKNAGKPKANSPGTVEHMMAERKRRQKLSQQFLELSSLVPGLKKIDKGSVLAACIQYVKELQTRVQELEEQTSTKTMESAVFVKKFQVSSDIDSHSTKESSSGLTIEQLPVLQVKMSDRNVLIQIQCEKRKEAMAQILLETEKLNLNVISSNVISFGNSIFDITIMAQMNADSNMSTCDLVKSLGSSII